MFQFGAGLIELIGLLCQTAVRLHLRTRAVARAAGVSAWAATVSARALCTALFSCSRVEANCSAALVSAAWSRAAACAAARWPAWLPRGRGRPRPITDAPGRCGVLPHPALCAWRSSRRLRRSRARPWWWIQPLRAISSGPRLPLARRRVSGLGNWGHWHFACKGGGLHLNPRITCAIFISRRRRQLG